jgi:hypothetical protein
VDLERTELQRHGVDHRAILAAHPAAPGRT